MYLFKNLALQIIKRDQEKPALDTKGPTLVAVAPSSLGSPCEETQCLDFSPFTIPAEQVYFFTM